MCEGTITENDVIPLLKKLIQFNTENPPGRTIEAVRYIANILKSGGIKCEIQEYKEGHANLIAEYGEGEKSIILTGHIDTVISGDKKRWTYPPLSGEEHDGHIYGRGSTDMKGAVAAFIALLFALKKEKVKLNKKIVLLITSDEESLMKGSIDALERGIMNNCDFLLVGEPTELNIGIAEKGMCWVKVIVHGIASHGSRPELGVNAIEAASKLFSELKKIIPLTKHDLLDYSTINISTIKGGTPFVVPEYCDFDIDYRLPPNIDNNQVRSKFEETISQFNRNNKAKVELEYIFTIPAIEYNEQSDFITSLKEKAHKMGGVEKIGLAYGTDAGILVPPKNTPFVIFGPGRMDKLHVTDEFVEKKVVISYSNILLEALIDCYLQEFRET